MCPNYFSFVFPLYFSFFSPMVSLLPEGRRLRSQARSTTVVVAESVFLVQEWGGSPGETQRSRERDPEQRWFVAQWQQSHDQSARERTGQSSPESQKSRGIGGGHLLGADLVAKERRRGGLDHGRSLGVGRADH